MIFADGDSAATPILNMPGYVFQEGTGRIVPLAEPQPMLPGWSGIDLDGAWLDWREDTFCDPAEAWWD